MVVIGMLRYGMGVAAIVGAFFAAVQPAVALSPMDVSTRASALDLSAGLEWHRNHQGPLQITAAADAQGIVRRIEVPSSDDKARGTWVTFALTNSSDAQLDRLLVAPQYRLVGSGLFWPDLGTSRIRSVTPSQGFLPERQFSRQADVFRLTLDPGAVVTFVAELNGSRLPQLYLWEPNAYKDNVNRLAFYKGIVLGVAGLLALFLAVLMILRGGLVFTASAALAWAALAYLGIDFGFLSRFLALPAGGDQIYRAGGEALLAASLLLFVYSYLRLNRWHVGFVPLMLVGASALAGLMVLAVYQAPTAAGLARLSFGLITIAGIGLIVAFAWRGFDRAIMLVPTWLLLLAWVIGAGLVITGRISNDIAAPALAGGLVLIVLLIGFTVMQHAVAGGSMLHDDTQDRERRALALTGSGDMVWDWDIDRDRLFTSARVEKILGLTFGALNGPAHKWLDTLHPSDRDVYREALDGVVTHQRSYIAQELRLKAHDGHYLTFLLRARPVIGTDGAIIRCVGTIADITETKLAQERLLHDAVNDNLTGLPNRLLYHDRLQAVLTRTRLEQAPGPTLMAINVDRFRAVNDAHGLAVGDAILLTISRRLMRLLRPQDTLARIGGDRFAVMLTTDHDAKSIARFAKRVRAAVNEPISFSMHELSLTCSIGIVRQGADSISLDAVTLLRDAELAMYHARGLGGDRIEVFRPALRQGSPVPLETELAGALDRNQIELYYQPIVSLEDNMLRGFEALMRWRHPRRGLVLPNDFLAIAERNGQIADLGLYVLSQAAQQLGTWQRQYPMLQPLVMSVNISNRQLLRHDLVREIKAVVARSNVRPNTLILEITESLMIENPELASHIISQIQAFDIRLSLDDFGTGYSSLSNLRRFPFDMLKIDSTFVRQSEDKDHPHILGSIVSLAHDLGMEVVAEGIETKEDARQVAQFGAEYAQGFLYGRPMSQSQAEQYLTGYVGAIKAAE